MSPFDGPYIRLDPNTLSEARRFSQIIWEQTEREITPSTRETIRRAAMELLELLKPKTKRLEDDRT